MSADPEQILDDAVDRCEPLEMGGRLESTHLVLTLPYRLMRDLGSIVFVLPGTVDHGRQHGTMRGRVAAELVRDQPARLAALSLSLACGRTVWPPADCAAIARECRGHRRPRPRHAPARAVPEVVLYRVIPDLKFDSEAGCPPPGPLPEGHCPRLTVSSGLSPDPFVDSDTENSPRGLLTPSAGPEAP